MLKSLWLVTHLLDSMWSTTYTTFSLKVFISIEAIIGTMAAIAINSSWLQVALAHLDAPAAYSGNQSSIG